MGRLQGTSHSCAHTDNDGHINPFLANDEYTRPALHTLNDERRVYSFSKRGGLSASVGCLGAESADLRLDLDRGHVYQAVHRKNSRVQSRWDTRLL